MLQNKIEQPSDVLYFGLKGLTKGEHIHCSLWLLWRFRLYICRGRKDTNDLPFQSQQFLSILKVEINYSTSVLTVCVRRQLGHKITRSHPPRTNKTKKKSRWKKNENGRRGHIESRMTKIKSLAFDRPCFPQSNCRHIENVHYYTKRLQYLPFNWYEIGRKSVYK